eukprot:8772849-Karenia_brevis.AAC.1
MSMNDEKHSSWQFCSDMHHPLHTLALDRSIHGFEQIVLVHHSNASPAHWMLIQPRTLVLMYTSYTSPTNKTT